MNCISKLISRCFITPILNEMNLVIYEKQMKAIRLINKIYYQKSNALVIIFLISYISKFKSIIMMSFSFVLMHTLRMSHCKECPIMHGQIFKELYILIAYIILNQFEKIIIINSCHFSSKHMSKLLRSFMN